MTSMKKRLFRLVAVAAVLGMVSGIAGCGQEQTASEDGEVPTVTWIIARDKQSDMQSVLDAANEIIEPAIGAKLEIQTIDNASYNERMNMYMASSTVFDMCFTGFVNKYKTAVDRGGLLVIDDLIKNETTTLWDNIPEYMWEGAKINGKIYAVPNVQTVAAPSGVVIPKDLADKYGLDPSSIKRMGDLEPFLAAVKAGEPNMYPYRSNYGMNPWMMPDYENFEGDIVAIKKDDPEGTPVLLRTLPEFREAVEQVRDWYEKGYIRADVASVGDDTQDYNMGKYAVSHTTIKPGVEAGLKNDFGKEFYAIALGDPYVSMGNITNTMTGISRTSPNPDKAIKIIEMVNDNEELYNLLCFGIEGKHYNLTEDGRVSAIKDSGYYPNADWMFGNQFKALLTENLPADVWEQTEKQNDEATKSPLMGFVLNTDNIVNEISQCTSVNNEYGVIHNGTDDPANYFDEYLRRLDEAGQQKILEEVTRQVNEFKANR